MYSICIDFISFNIKKGAQTRSLFKPHSHMSGLLTFVILARFTYIRAFVGYWEAAFFEDIFHLRFTATELTVSFFAVGFIAGGHYD
jgi:hypothetical protein